MPHDEVPPSCPNDYTLPHNVPESSVTPAKADPPPSIAKSVSIITETTEPELGAHSSKQVNSSEGDLHTSSMVLLNRSPSPPSKLSKLEAPLSSAETKSLSSISKRSTDTQEDEFLSSLIQPSKVSVKDGLAIFKDLFLPPPPPPPVLSNLISTTSPSKEQPSSPTNTADTLTANKKKAPTQSFSQPNSLASRTLKANTGGRTASRLSEREKLLHAKREKYCAPGMLLNAHVDTLSQLIITFSGTYILKIYDVTDPPFMGSKLPDLFVQVRIVVPQKVSSPSSKTASRGTARTTTAMNDSTK